MIVFLVLPLLAIVAISFHSRGAYGEVERPLTLENYRRFLGFGVFGFEPLYPVIILRSILLGLSTVFFCACAGMPLAFFIARLTPRYKNIALTLVVIPLWTNLLIRTYAWQIIFAPDSLLASTASSLGLLTSGEGLYPGAFAVTAGMVCDFLPFLVLPLYASVEKIDWSVAEAAMDLGANRWGVFRHAIFPQITPGLAAGIMLVFLPAMGQFVVPDLLGGAKTVMIGNALQQQFGPSRDWPFGSSVTVLVLLLVLACLWAYARLTARKEKASLW